MPPSEVQSISKMVSDSRIKTQSEYGTLKELTCIVFSIDYKPMFGGIAEHTFRIALNLRRRGANVYMVAPKITGSELFDKAQPFKTVRVPQLPFVDWIIYLFVLIKLIASHKVGFVYCATSYPCGFICRLLKLFRSVRVGVGIHAHEVVYGGHNLRQRIKKALRRFQIWAFINGADRVFAVSHFTAKQAIAAGVKAEKISVIYNGIDLDEIDRIASDHDFVRRFNMIGKRIILTVGRLEWRKGFDMVIRAMPSVLKMVPDAVYLIVGDGKIRQHLEDLSRRLGVADKVIFMGSLPRKDVLVIMKACDVLVMPSRQVGTSVEGFGIVFLEASACGKPVIGGRSGGIADAVEDGVTGLLVDPEDPEEIAGSITRILLDKQLANRLGSNGRERVKQDFTWDKVVDRIIAAMLQEPIAGNTIQEILE